MGNLNADKYMLSASVTAAAGIVGGGPTEPLSEKAAHIYALVQRCHGLMDGMADSSSGTNETPKVYGLTESLEQVQYSLSALESRLAIHANHIGRI